jgi:hypothetical protein
MSKGLLEILKKESIRLVDGRYSNGFADLDDLNKLIELGQAEVYDNGMEFVRLVSRKESK